jgi:hypothetical protein
MDINFFDLSGGINQSTTKTELGLSVQKIYWTDSKNVELYNNRGIIRQNGNSLYIELPESEPVIKLCQMEADGDFKLLIITASGKIYVYDDTYSVLSRVNKTLSGSAPIVVPFLRGVIISTESDKMFYVKNNENYDVVEYTVRDIAGEILYPDFITVHKGRVWCSKGSTVYYSAIGSYSDFTTPNDAGYINDFHTDTADIISMFSYKDYLAIYKRERVYLLSGSNPSDFAVTLFADRGAYASEAVVNVDNKQLFLSDGIYTLEQVGELNQIRLGSEISTKIRKEFGNFDKSRINKSFALHYGRKHQVWFFIPYFNNSYFQTIWINDYLNRCWYKRVVPQKITASCMFNSDVVSADTDGKIYIEDYGNTFDGVPVEFMWKSPFISFGNVLHRKLIDEFYFVLDDVQDNNFNFSLYKDYDGEYKEDVELIYSKHYTHFMWSGEDTPDTAQYKWNDGESASPVWPVTTNVMEKAEICGSNLSIQLCVEGSEITDNCAIIGLQFREIYNDD